jgi:hypothetical protein
MRQNIMLLAAVGAPTNATRRQLAQAIGRTVNPGQRQPHSSKDSPRQRRQRLAELGPLPLWGLVTIMPVRPDVRSTRDRLLQSVAIHAAEAGATELLLDYQQADEAARDRRALAAATRGSSLSYGHVPMPHTADPLVAAADIVVWAAGRSDYRSLLPSWLTWIEVP